MRTRVVVRLQFEATHCWKGCPIPEVDFLREKHRHVFHIEAKKDVTHDDRDVEIIMLKREIVQWLSLKFPVKNELECPHMKQTSCEMLARMILKEFGLSYCSVLEDNENGAEIFKEDSDG